MVYSEDTGINLAMNRLNKRVWSGMWLVCDYLTLLSLAALLVPLVSRGTADAADFFVFMMLQIAVVGIIVSAIVWMGKKRSDILAGDKSPLAIDDDVYWKNGWYSNPGDKRLFVEDRLCSANFSMNMAKTSAKVLMGIFGGVTLLGLIWICAVFIRLDFVKPELKISAQEVQVTAGMYDISFPRDEIREVELLPGLPKERLRRTNGADTNDYLIGKFRGNVTGNCRLYVYKGYQPVLAIRLPEYTVFINSKSDGQAETWYDRLK